MLAWGQLSADSNLVANLEKEIQQPILTRESHTHQQTSYNNPLNPLAHSILPILVV